MAHNPDRAPIPPLSLHVNPSYTSLLHAESSTSREIWEGSALWIFLKLGASGGVYAHWIEEQDAIRIGQVGGSPNVKHRTAPLATAEKSAASPRANPSSRRRGRMSHPRRSEDRAARDCIHASTAISTSSRNSVYDFQGLGERATCVGSKVRGKRKIGHPPQEIPGPELNLAYDTTGALAALLHFSAGGAFTVEWRGRFWHRPNPGRYRPFVLLTPRVSAIA
jgi:hypothetical protein